MVYGHPSHIRRKPWIFPRNTERFREIFPKPIQWFMGKPCLDHGTLRAVMPWILATEPPASSCHSFPTHVLHNQGSKMKDSKHVVILDMVFIICESVIPKHCAIKIMHAPFHCAFHLLRKFNTKPLSTVKACTQKKKNIENGKKN